MTFKSIIISQKTHNKMADAKQTNNNKKLSKIIYTDIYTASQVKICRGQIYLVIKYIFYLFSNKSPAVKNITGSQTS